MGGERRARRRTAAGPPANGKAARLEPARPTTTAQNASLAVKACLLLGNAFLGRGRAMTAAGLLPREEPEAKPLSGAELGGRPEAGRGGA